MRPSPCRRAALLSLTLSLCLLVACRAETARGGSPADQGPGPQGTVAAAPEEKRPAVTPPLPAPSPVVEKVTVSGALMGDTDDVMNSQPHPIHGRVLVIPAERLAADQAEGKAQPILEDLVAGGFVITGELGSRLVVASTVVGPHGGYSLSVAPGEHVFCVANVWVCTRDQADYPVYVHGAAVVTVTAAEQQRVDLIVEGMRGPVIARRGARRGRGRRVNVLDLIELLLCFGQPGDPPCDTADLNADGAVNVLDLINLLLAFGTECP